MRQFLLLIITCSSFACGNNSDEQKVSPLTDTSKTTVVNAPPSGKIDIETFGPIRIGQSEKDLLAAIGQPEKRSGSTLWEADGLMHETWTYSAKGLELGMQSEESSQSGKTVFSITAIPPCDFKTRAGMGIGSTESGIRSAYSRDVDSSMSSTEQIVIGSVYGGIVFDIKDGKAAKVFLGALAE